jgi:SWI/SNF-related matrix-associated actin-dependent regulator 1 of chromatin subfamily A
MASTVQANMESQQTVRNARRNSYPGYCASCQQSVAAGHGFIFLANGRWKTRCSSAACARKLGLADETGAPPRQLTDDGRVIMPYDPDALNLLRAMPGARWRAEQGCWTVSLDAADRTRVLELAGKLGLTIAPELTVVQADPAVTAAADRARAVGAYPYQVEGVEWIAARQRALLGDDMGVGKTLQALVALPERARAVVIVPAAVKYTWRDEAARWRSDLTVRIVEGRRADSSALVPAEGEVVVTNYDVLPADLLPVDKSKPAPIAAAAIAAKFAGVTLIVDEAHRTKNPKAARSKKVRTLSKLCSRTLFLTGTPLLTRPQDLFGLLQAGGMDRDVFGGWKGFVRDFGGYQESVARGVVVWKFTGPAPYVPDKLRRVMLRRTKAEVLKDLPPKRRATLVVNGLDGTLRDELDELWLEHQDEIQAGHLPPFEAFSAIRAALASQRIPALLSMVEDYEEQGVSLVVFSAHRAPIDTLAAREGWLAITGDTQDKQAVARAFQSGEYKGIAVTIPAGGVGLTLTHAAHAIFVDRDWTPALNLQAEDRLHRIGQDADSVLYTCLVSDHALERHINDLLVRKMQLIEAAIERTLPALPPRTADGGLVPETDEELAARMKAREEAAAAAEREHARERVAAIAGRERAKVARPEPELTAALKVTIRAALDHMLARCDGAVEKDFTGFNKPDAAIMHLVGATGLEDSDETTWRVAERILSRYHRQLSDNFPKLFSHERGT